MAKKYIRIVELAQVTGRPYNEILSLVNTGVLFGHKTHRGRWLINIDAAEKYSVLKSALTKRVLKRNLSNVLQFHHNIKQRIDLTKGQTEIVNRIPGISHHSDDNIPHTNSRVV